MDILDDYSSIKSVLETMAGATGGILFNCNAGKDRTGMIAFIVLLILDVPIEDILADYQISYTFLREMIRKMHRDNPELPSFRGLSKMEYMEKTADEFFSKYNTLEEYLSAAGVAASVTERIKVKGLGEE
jgi:protein-tyrosine phosphatase